jgi:hypothetical protein
MSDITQKPNFIGASLDQVPVSAGPVANPRLISGSGGKSPTGSNLLRRRWPDATGFGAGLSDPGGTEWIRNVRRFFWLRCALRLIVMAVGPAISGMSGLGGEPPLPFGRSLDHLLPAGLQHPRRTAGARVIATLTHSCPRWCLIDTTGGLSSAGNTCMDERRGRVLPSGRAVPHPGKVRSLTCVGNHT